MHTAFKILLACLLCAGAVIAAVWLVRAIL